MKRILLYLIVSTVIAIPALGMTIQSTFSDKEITTIKKVNAIIQQKNDLKTLNEIHAQLTTLATQYPHEKIITSILSFTKQQIMAYEAIYGTEHTNNYGLFDGQYAALNTTDHPDQTPITPLRTYYKSLVAHDRAKAAAIKSGTTASQIQQTYRHITFAEPFNIHFAQGYSQNCTDLSQCGFFLLYQEKNKQGHKTDLYYVTMNIDITGNTITTISSYPLTRLNKKTHATYGDTTIASYMYDRGSYENKETIGAKHSKHTAHGNNNPTITLTTVEKQGRILSLLPHTHTHGKHFSIGPYHAITSRNMLIYDTHKDRIMLNLRLTANEGAWLNDHTYYICSSEGAEVMPGKEHSGVYIVDIQNHTITLATFHDTTQRIRLGDTPCTNDGNIKTYNYLTTNPYNYDINTVNDIPYTLNTLKQINGSRHVVAQ